GRAETGLPHPAPRRLEAAEGGREGLVDVDGAAPDLARHRAGTRAVLAVDRRVEAVLPVVRAGDGLTLVLEAVRRHDRPEGLVAADAHLRSDALEDRGLVEERAEVGPGLAAGEDPGALGGGVVDMPDD